MSVKRWVLSDPYDTNSATNHYTFPRNPVAMTSLNTERQVTSLGTLGGTILLHEVRARPRQWQFNGPILDKAHYDALYGWVYDRRRRVQLTDHFGRTISLVLTTMEAVPVRRREHLLEPRLHHLRSRPGRQPGHRHRRRADPMRDIPTSMRTALRDGLFIGEHRPIARVTVQHPTMKLRNYSFVPLAVQRTIAKLPIAKRAAARKKGTIAQCYADFFFTTMGKPMELPNVKSVEWSRSTDSDVADCTITVWNTRPLSVGETPSGRDIDQAGYYTYSRGASKFSAAWKQTKNPWFGMLVPDNIIRTYEGYGYDPSVPPEKDGHLLLSGVWMIDTVEMNADTTMSIKCRDVGRLLLDQIAVKPLIPTAWYPNDWQAWPAPTKSTLKRTQLAVKADDSSNTPWIGDPRYNSVRGHKLSYAFDGNPNTYWLSIGNVSPSRRFAYEWVQATVGNQSVTEVRFRTKKKGYTAYVSVKVGGQWLGSKDDQLPRGRHRQERR
jgi:hypothetical protein